MTQSSKKRIEIAVRKVIESIGSSPWNGKHREEIIYDLVEATTQEIQRVAGPLVQLLTHAANRDHSTHVYPAGQYQYPIEKCPMVVCVDYRLAITNYKETIKDV